MSNQNESATKGGVGVSGLLGVAFVVLKLIGVINWSWWWVLLPFYYWIPVVVLIVGVYVITEIVGNK